MELVRLHHHRHLEVLNSLPSCISLGQCIAGCLAVLGSLYPPTGASRESVLFRTTYVWPDQQAATTKWPAACQTKVKQKWAWDHWTALSETVCWCLQCAALSSANTATAISLVILQSGRWVAHLATPKRLSQVITAVVETASECASAAKEDVWRRLAAIVRSTT